MLVSLLSLVAGILYWAIDIICLLIVVRSLFSWAPVNRDNKLMIILDYITEPFVAPIRAIINKLSISRNMPIDFSPVIALLVLFMIQFYLNSLR